MELLRWDATADVWDVLIFEAEKAGAMEATLTFGRAAVPGFPKVTNVARGSPVQETVGRTAELFRRLGMV